MNNFKEEFNEYMKACYRDIDLVPNQESEVKQAYYAGAFTAMNQLISEMDKDESAEGLERFANDFYREIATVLQAEKEK